MSGIMQATLGTLSGAAGGGTLLYNLDAMALGALPESSITTSAEFPSEGTLTYVAGYLQINAGNKFAFSGDFTVEGWYYPRSGTGARALFSLGLSENPGRYRFYLSGTSVISNFYPAQTVTYTSTVNYDTWTHIAVVRSGSTVRVYINGTASATTDTQVGTLGDGSSMIIGANYQSIPDIWAQYYVDSFKGNISNFRVVNSAVYTGNFTPPTTTLRAVPGTVLLLPLTAQPLMDLSSNFCSIINTSFNNRVVVTSVRAPSLTTGTTDLTGTYTITYSLPVATFTGSISGNILTVSGVTGTIKVGMTITGGSVPAGTFITSTYGSDWQVSASLTQSSTGMVGKQINWLATQGGIFSTYGAGLNYDNITGGPNILANTSYSVMMAYKLNIGLNGGFSGRLLNSYGQTQNPGGWIMGGYNGFPSVFYSDPYGNFYGSLVRDTIWHIDFVTYDKTSQLGKIFSCTNTQPETPTQSFNPFSNQGVLNGFRLFSRSTGDEWAEGNIGVIKAWIWILRMTNPQKSPVFQCHVRTVTAIQQILVDIKAAINIHILGKKW
jgi:hypothetical protein